MWHKKGVMMLKIQLWSQKSVPFYNTGTSQKWEYQEGQYFLSLDLESETHILYRYITQSEIFQAFIFLKFEWLWLTDNENPKFCVSIRILHKINKKGYFKQKCQASEKYVHFYALNTW